MAVIWIEDFELWCDGDRIHPLDPVFDDPNEFRHNQDDDLVACCLCGNLLDEDDAVKTKYGLAHESCAEKRWPVDPGDTRYPR